MTLQARIDRRNRTVDIFGGGSGYTEDDPYHIDLARLRDKGVGEWVAHLAGKTWFLDDHAGSRQVIETIVAAARRGEGQKFDTVELFPRCALTLGRAYDTISGTVGLDQE